MFFRGHPERVAGVGARVEGPAVSHPEQGLPKRGFALDQRNLLGANPPFELLFAGDGCAGRMIALEINQAVDLVFPGERSVAASFVLRNADGEVACDADVEDARLAGENVDVVPAVGIVHVDTVRL